MKMYHCLIDYGYGIAEFYTPYFFDKESVKKRFKQLASTILDMHVCQGQVEILSEDVVADLEHERLEFEDNVYLWREDGARLHLEPYHRSRDGWNTYYCDICKVRK